MAAKTSAGIVNGVYHATFQALFKDAEAHGRGKVMSGIIQYCMWVVVWACFPKIYRTADSGQ